MDSSHIPEGFHTITPFILADDPPALLEFVEKALDAKVTQRMTKKDGSIMHAQFQVGDSRVMVGEAMGNGKPALLLYLYVEDADKLYEQAVKAGGEVIAKPSDQFYGDRAGAIKDPEGNQWWLATQKEKLSDEEMQKRITAGGF